MSVQSGQLEIENFIFASSLLNTRH